MSFLCPSERSCLWWTGLFDCGIDFGDWMSLLVAVECHGISRCLVAFGVCLVPKVPGPSSFTLIWRPLRVEGILNFWSLWCLILRFLLLFVSDLFEVTEPRGWSITLSKCCQQASLRGHFSLLLGSLISPSASHPFRADLKSTVFLVHSPSVYWENT